MLHCPGFEDVVGEKGAKAQGKRVLREIILNRKIRLKRTHRAIVTILDEADAPGCDSHE